MRAFDRLATRGWPDDVRDAVGAARRAVSRALAGKDPVYTAELAAIGATWAAAVDPRAWDCAIAALEGVLGIGRQASPIETAVIEKLPPRYSARPEVWYGLAPFRPGKPDRFRQDGQGSGLPMVSAPCQQASRWRCLHWRMKSTNRAAQWLPAVSRRWVKVARRLPSKMPSWKPSIP